MILTIPENVLKMWYMNICMKIVMPMRIATELSIAVAVKKVHTQVNADIHGG
jgi:hypothetical protein